MTSYRRILDRPWTHRFVVFLILAALGLSVIPLQSVQAQLPIYKLQGVTYSPKGEPMAGVQVVLYPDGGGERTETMSDENGAYVIDGLLADTYNVTASSPCCQDEFVQITFDKTGFTVVHDFHLESKEIPVTAKVVVLSGKVKDAKTGAAIPGVSLSFDNYFSTAYTSNQTSNQTQGGSGGVAMSSPEYYPSRQEYQFFQTTSGDDGAYRVEMNEGSVNVFAHKEGYDHTRGGFQMYENRTLDIPMRSSEGQSVTIRGTVMGSDGRPVVSANVQVSPDYNCYEACMASDSSAVKSGGPDSDVYFYYENSNSPYNYTMTNENGKYEFKTSPGSLRVTVYHHEYLHGERAVTAQGGETKQVDFTLTRIPPDSVRIFGRVLDDESGKPVPWAQVNLENQLWGHYNYTTTKEDGTFEFWTKPGYTIVTASAYRWYYSPCESSPPRPMAVYAEEEASPESAEPSSTSTVATAGTTVSPSYGPCSSGEREREYYPRSFTFVAKEKQEQKADFRLVPRPLPDAGFQGYVLNASSKKGVPDANVQFYNEFTRDWGQATTDQDGSFKIRVHAGYYTIRVYAPGFFDVVTNVVLQSGETKRLDLTAEPGEKRYGGYCCYYGGGGYAAEDMAMSAPAKQGYRSSGPTPTMVTMAAGRDGSASGQQAYKGEAGGLGPYSPASVKSGGTAPFPVAPLVLVLLGAVAGALAIVRRR